jgi:hypothetical protein
MSDEGFELNLESLREWDLEMRDIYLSAAEFLANPPRPNYKTPTATPSAL